MRALAIWLSRRRVRKGSALMRAGRRLIETEERRWGLAPPSWRWRVPDVRQRR